MAYKYRLTVCQYGCRKKEKTFPFFLHIALHIEMTSDFPRLFGFYYTKWTHNKKGEIIASKYSSRNK